MPDHALGPLRRPPGRLGQAEIGRRPPSVSIAPASLPLKCQRQGRAGGSRPTCPGTVHNGRAGGAGQGRPRKRARKARQGLEAQRQGPTGPLSDGKALEARQGRDWRLCRLARCAARHSRFSRPQAGRIPRSLAPQVSKSGSHRQKRRCEIQRRRPSSSELAMGPSVHRQRWRWSTVVWTWPASPEMAMIEKKSRLDLGRLSRGRAAVIACNAPGHR